MALLFVLAVEWIQSQSQLDGLMTFDWFITISWAISMKKESVSHLYSLLRCMLNVLYISTVFLVLVLLVLVLIYHDYVRYKIIPLHGQTIWKKYRYCVSNFKL